MILVDSGPLIAAAIVKQNHHRACVDLFTGLGLAGRRLLVPHTVVAETAYMLHSYAGVREIATLDRRHLTAVRPSHVEAFTCCPRASRDASGPQTVRKKSSGDRN